MDLQRRIERLFEHCDPVPEAILIEGGTRGEADPNLFYVTGFEWGVLYGPSAILVRGERPQLVVCRMDAEIARKDENVDVIVADSRREHDQFLTDRLEGLERIGYNPHGLTAARFRALTDRLPHAKWVDVSSASVAARLVKDADEISRLRKASEITTQALERALSCLREGMTETDLAAEVNYRLQIGGAARLAFGTIVAFGANTSEPHHAPGDTVLTWGSLVVVDLGARYRQYCADMTRTIAFGEIGDTEVRMHSVVSEAQRAALAALVPGRSGRDVHEAADGIIQASEFKGRFLHSTGHSVGLEAQDGAALSAHSEVRMEPGMVFTVEPGIYIPGIGGVRIEDIVLVTESGNEVLSEASRLLTSDSRY